MISGDIEHVYAEPRPDHVKHSLADISEASLFGFYPYTDFKSDLRKLSNILLIPKK